MTDKKLVTILSASAKFPIKSPTSILIQNTFYFFKTLASSLLPLHLCFYQHASHLFLRWSLLALPPQALCSFSKAYTPVTQYPCQSLVTEGFCMEE